MERESRAAQVLALTGLICVPDRRQMYAKAKEAVSRALAALRHNREVQKRISEERFAALEAKSVPFHHH